MSIVFNFLLLNLCFGDAVFGDRQPETILGQRNPLCIQKLCVITNVYITQPQDFQMHYHHNMEAINGITFLNSTIHFLPTSLFPYFPSITRLECVRCELSEFSRNNFKGAANLKLINFSYNNVTVVLGNSFIESPNLVEINLSHNHIGSINANAFNNLSQLEILNLDNNTLQTIISALFASLESLKILRLGDNKIASPLTADFFGSNRNLKELHLNSNLIDTIASNAVSSCNQLEVLSFYANRITEFSLDNEFEAMRELDVSHNLLTNLNISFRIADICAHNNLIRQFSIKHPTNLVELRLRLNALSNVDFISEMVNLEFLDVSDNSLTSIFNASNLEDLSALKYLYLENVNLTAINYETFAHQTQLTELDISYNNLKSIDLINFSGMTNLDTLYIDGNSLTHIDELEDFDIFCPSLRLIGISDNNFNCKHLREIVRKLKDMNVIIFTKHLNMIRNQTNFRRIACSNNNTIDESAVPPLPKILPEHHNHEFHANHNTELTETRRALNASLSEGMRLQNQLEIMQMTIEVLQNSFDAYQAENQTKSQDSGLQELNQKIDDFLKDFRKIETPSFEQNVESTVERVESEESSTAIAGNIKTIKVLVSLLFAAVIIFIVIKGLLSSFRRQYTHLVRSNVTTATNIDDDM